MDRYVEQNLDDAVSEPARFSDTYEIEELRGKFKDEWLRSLEARDKLLDSLGLERARLPWCWVGRRRIGHSQTLTNLKGQKIGKGVWGGYNYGRFLAQKEAEAIARAQAARARTAAEKAAALAELEPCTHINGWAVYKLENKNGSERHFAHKDERSSRIYCNYPKLVAWCSKDKHR